MELLTTTRVWEAFDDKLKVISTVPANAETFDAWSGKIGDCLSAAIDYEGWHVFLGKVRKCVVKALAKQYPQKTKKDGDKEVICESEAVYVARLLAENTITQEQLQTIGDEALEADGLTFESCLRSDGATRGAVPKKYITQAQDAIAAWQAGVNPKTGQPASSEKTLNGLRQRLPNAKLVDDTSVDEVAKLFRDYDNAQSAGSLI